jgi:hypothetical protein
LPLDTLLRRAIASYNAFHEELPMASVVMTTGEEVERSGPAFLERMTVNFIRPEYAEECKRQMRAGHGEAQDATG